MPTSPELVVLVDEKNEVLGTAPKATVHTGDTPLHRGFSVFLFRSNGDLLLQQRARRKKTWPLVWSNSCCGHPGPGEEPIDAARRRLKDELGIAHAEVLMMLPDYRYRAAKDGVVENELCPVMAARSDEAPSLNPDEVEAIEWVPWEEFVTRTTADPSRYSPWCNEETVLLQNDPTFRRFLTDHVVSKRI